MLNNKKIELLAPAGDMGKLDVALEYGADAVYLSGKSLGMRAARVKTSTIRNLSPLPA